MLFVCYSSPNPFTGFDFVHVAEARDRLRKLREEQLRRSDEVVELWEDFLDCVHYKLGTECMYLMHCVASVLKL